MNTFEEQEYTKGFDLSLWKKLFKCTLAYKKQVIYLALTMIIMAVIDVTFPLATKYAINTFIEAKDFSTMPVFIAIFLGLIILQCLNVYWFIVNSGKLETGIVYDIRKTGFKKLQELSFSYFDNKPVGWIMARLSSDTQKIGDVLAWNCIDLIWGSAFVVVIVFCMFMLNVVLACIILGTVPFLVVATYIFQKLILKSQRDVRKRNSKITAAINEGINGARTSKTLVREDANFAEFEALTSDMRIVSIRSAVLSSIFLPVVLSLGSLAIGAVMWAGGVQVMDNLLDFGTLSVFVSYSVQIFEPIQQLARAFAEMQSAQASAERTFSLLEMQPDIVDSKEVIAKYGDAINPIKQNWEKINGEITFQNVSFYYNEKEPVLNNFNLKVTAGEKIALVGETGAGKTTIVNLLCRFYEPVSGKILIDGIDYKERAQIWLQSNLGYVLQTPHLFSGTIMENIRYGKLDATNEEIINATKIVNAYDFIMKKEEQFETEVGEGGDKLSTGEKQLISFARAILSNPRIFILDEATASIDTQTEQIIQAAINKVLTGRTSFIIAHRLSTIRACDRILVIENGELIEEGSHNSLIKQKGHY